MAEKDSTNDEAVGHEVTGGTWNTSTKAKNVKWKTSTDRQGQERKWTQSVFSAKWTSVPNGQHKQIDMEKQGQQTLKTSVHWKSGQACSSAFPTHSWQGLPPPASNSLYLALHTSGMSKIQNVGCLNAFHLPPYHHDRLPSLRPSERSDIRRS